MLIILMSIILSSTMNQSNLRLGESGSLERVYMLDSSLSRVLRSMDNNINISIDDSSPEKTIVSIVESPTGLYSQYNSEFFTELNALESFMFGEQPEIVFYLSKITNPDEKLPLILNPHYINYSHIEEDGNVALVIYPETYYTKIVISLYFPEDEIDSDEIEWTVSSTNSGPGSIFNITVSDYTGQTYSEEDYLNLDEINRFIINEDVEVTVGNLCYSCIKVEMGEIHIISNTTFELIPSYETTSVNYKKGLYIMNFSDIGIYLNKSVKIL
ncbi:hypothetical protein HOC06_02925 [Candidatus Woesearchaeota archaeon]|nr:hypothetical protein [Candidatus Woesearchaeota archaeon]